ncbi:MAG: flavin reductase family protein [Bacteroidota bacterium]
MSDILSLDPNEISQRDRHGYLLAAVAPRPIAFASTVDEQGRVNLSPFSFFNVFGSNPPIVIFSPARRGRDNTSKHTLDNLKQVPETVVNIVNYPMVEQMSLASTEYAEGVNEFVKAGFQQVPSEVVKPPRVGEAPVAFECTIDQIIETGTEGGAGNLVIARVVRMHIQKKYLDEAGKLDTRKLDLVGRMGGIWYTRASGSALFEIPKPSRDLGMGVDKLPESVRLSPWLTGNELGRLGNLQHPPTEEKIREAKLHPGVQAVLSLKNPASEAGREMLHLLASSLLKAGETEMAQAILWLDA